ncbi:MAG TPA: hypothetical protein VHD89_00015 [Rhodanobacteraceae bacterium]|jgi:hypothetical protein|nr:hypothetical protein [Rhodanobacteraceae bacterium]
MDLRNRRRLQAVVIVGIFAASMIGAAAMMMSGWSPPTRSYGTPIRPERDLAQMPAQLADGKPLAFRSHEAAWTLVALPGPDCAERCLRQLDLVHRAQITLDKQADMLRLVYLGAPPQGAAAEGFDKVWTLATTSSPTLEDFRPKAADSVSAVLVTPSGKAMLSYPAGFDPTRLRGDLKKAVQVAL